MMDADAWQKSLRSWRLGLDGLAASTIAAPDCIRAHVLPDGRRRATLTITAAADSELFDYLSALRVGDATRLEVNGVAMSAETIAAGADDDARTVTRVLLLPTGDVARALDFQGRALARRRRDPRRRRPFGRNRQDPRQ